MSRQKRGIKKQTPIFNQHIRSLLRHHIMMHLKRFCLFLTILISIVSCSKNDESDFRNAYIGDYSFTKIQGNHDGWYAWTSDGPGTEPYTEWTESHTEDTVWQSNGTIEKKGGSDRLKISYGNGEEFVIEVSTTGEINCVKDNCDDMTDPPFTPNAYSDGAWLFPENEYFMDLGNNISTPSLPYGGWSYKDWRIVGEKL